MILHARITFSFKTLSFRVEISLCDKEVHLKCLVKIRNTHVGFRGLEPWNIIKPCVLPHLEQLPATELLTSEQNRPHLSATSAGRVSDDQPSIKLSCTLLASRELLLTSPAWGSLWSGRAAHFSPRHHATVAPSS